MGWKAFLARVAVLCLALGVTMRVAMARDGEPGGRARSFVTIAGTVTGVAAGDTMMRFTFRRTVSADGGTREQRCEREVRVGVATTGEFAAEVPLEPFTMDCPDNFFDGSDVRVDVSIGGVAVVDGGAVNPVPYAIHADTAATATTATVASQYGTPDCPVGYTRATDPTFTGEMRLCQRRNGATVLDEVVRVGAGATAFWVDRYEASVWSRAETTGVQYGLALEDFPTEFPRNGQATTPAYAVSRAGVTPSRWITWFQANAACRLAGKRLLLGDEWLTAASGTTDPSTPNSGDDGSCVTGRPGGSPRMTGGGARCQSRWGAQDLIGNLAEWTGEWVVDTNNGAGVSDAEIPMPDTSAGGLYYGDGTFGVAAGSNRYYFGPDPRRGGASIAVGGALATVLRGGSFPMGTGAGTYSHQSHLAPSWWHPTAGFRCVIPR